MPGISFAVGRPDPSNSGDWTGLFVKFPTLPALDTVLLDLSFGLVGYWRVVLTTAGHISLRAYVNGALTTVDLTPGAALTPGLFYWVVTSNSFNGGQGQSQTLRLGGRVTAPGGTVVGAVTTVLGTFTATYTCLLGVGVGVSGGSEAVFPNAAGWEMSKVHVGPGSSIAFGATLYLPDAPTSDFGAVPTVSYNCRDGIGAASSLADASGNSVTLTAAAQGLTVNAEGPFA